ncbi:RNA polymerase subunit sigma-70 [Streptomyces albidoflavus]|uniref:RNA polymerase subunit sigma-70 n=1 Tax=Streptomyces albidoflavus TaxID=1886 RepID=UPI00101E2BF7|nr:RNA polymerase subunit sigma-70 [Streptomyces albidoflavus]RZD78360.1 RNA polymerase subunit sigma-70 [Streptomyces albidoflavus]RZD96295.1 RNA polymerase subunit sigma-70 [Streptomyces albidoflavus]
MGDEVPAMVRELEGYRGELVRHCYRMLGSYAEAEDAAQQALVRAWRNAGKFEGRSSLRSWVYRIATNVCLDALAAGRRRALPMDLSGPSDGAAPPGVPADSALWIGPLPGGDPADSAMTGESVRLAFVAALQHLPPKQRATLLLRDVLGFSAREVADLHGCTLASANSALQRARSTLADRRDGADELGLPAPGGTQQVLAERYAAAFSRYDMEELGLLLHVDATLSLPPYAKWMCGMADIKSWLTGPAVGCRGSRLIPTVANSSPAFGQYRPRTDRTGYEPWALQVLEFSGDRIASITAFRDTALLFPQFGLPGHLSAEACPGVPT